MFSWHVRHHKFINHEPVHDHIRFLGLLVHQTRTLRREGQPKEVLGVMDQSGTVMDTEAYASIMDACTNIRSLKQVHARIFLSKLEQNLFLGTKLVSMYAKCGSLENARLVFDRMCERNVFLWNAMIRGYARIGPFGESLALCYQMRRSGIQGDNFTFLEVLKACVCLSALLEGKEIHGYIVRSGIESDVFLGAALIEMYAKCGSIEVARQVFDKMFERDVVVWSGMVAGYAQSGHANEALTLFHAMQLTDVKPNGVTVVNVLRACAGLSALREGKEIHGYVVRRGFELDVFVETALVDMYAKCGKIEIAQQLFDKMSKRDVVSWTAMIAGYAQSGNSDEALRLFHQMQRAGVKLNRVTVLSVLPACADLRALQQGRDIHDFLLNNGFDLDISVETALVAMYAKCGCLEVARELFDKMSKRDVVSWNAMVAGYAKGRYTYEALTLFHQMQLTDVEPDSITMAMPRMEMLMRP